MIQSSHQHAWLSVAPMMDYTDRHFRYFLRLIDFDVLLYTEMVTAHAIHHGHAEHLLAFDVKEQPVVLQVGGSDPALLVNAAKHAERLGYDAINLNVGCPSDRVKSGHFGACLMLEPTLVADCVQAMQSATHLPVTVKTRTGVDRYDDYDFLKRFIEIVAQAGCDTFIIHARKAWLSGLSPKQNREIPPLNYETVFQVKRDFPELTIILNGGLNTLVDVEQVLPYCDGVMIGREIVRRPLFLSELMNWKTHSNQCIDREKLLEDYLGYVVKMLQAGEPKSFLLKPLFGLMHGEPGAREWRRAVQRLLVSSCSSGEMTSFLNSAKISFL